MRVVIAGGGFGGLKAAGIIRERFSPSELDIVLIDKHRYFTYYASVHELISETTTKEDITVDFASNLSRRNIGFVHDEIVALNPTDKFVQTKKHKIDFDYLIIALGAIPNFFNLPGAKENTIPLKSVVSSETVNQKIRNDILRHKKSSIVICGSGLTGVEVAFEVKDLLKKLAKTYDTIDKSPVTLVEAMPNILPAFGANVQKVAEEELNKWGIEVKKGFAIEKITETEVILKTGEKIPYTIAIWTAGIAPPPAIATFGLELSQRGYITVNEYLQTTKFKNIYCIGDNSFFFNESVKKPMPQTAQAADDEAKVAAKNIIRDILGKPLEKFVPKKNMMSLISLGQKTAIFTNNYFAIKGRIFSVLKRKLEQRITKSLKGE